MQNAGPPWQAAYEGKDKDGKPVKITYYRSGATGVPEDIDANFLNDQYWLLLPFHVIWDTSATVTDEGTQKTAAGEWIWQEAGSEIPARGRVFAG